MKITYIEQGDTSGKFQSAHTSFVKIGEDNRKNQKQRTYVLEFTPSPTRAIRKVVATAFVLEP